MDGLDGQTRQIDWSITIKKANDLNMMRNARLLHWHSARGGRTSLLLRALRLSISLRMLSMLA